MGGLVLFYFPWREENSEAWSQIISRPSNGYMMDAGLARELIDVEIVGGNSQSVLYKKDIAEILQMQVFAGVQRRCYIPHLSLFTGSGLLSLKLQVV